jgi:hypothetical protein
VCTLEETFTCEDTLLRRIFGHSSTRAEKVEYNLKRLGRLSHVDETGGDCSVHEGEKYSRKTSSEKIPHEI